LILDDALVFKTLFTGSYERDDVNILWQPSPLTFPAMMQKEIEHHWDTLPKEHIFNGLLARLDHWSATPVRCQFSLRPSDYRTLLYSNQHIQHIKDSWGFSYLSRALGISAVTLSSDNQLLFIKRSNSVGEFPNSFDVFGGHIDVPLDSAPCIFDAMSQEIKEEMDLEPTDYELSLIGLIETTAAQKPELVFQSRINRTAKEIIEIAKKSQDNIEFSEIYSIFNSHENIKTYLEKNGEDFSPSAIGSLCVYLQTILNIGS
jgi:hypothetical protein